MTGLDVVSRLDALVRLELGLGKRKAENREQRKRKKETGSRKNKAERKMGKRKSGEGKTGEKTTSLSRAWLPDATGCFDTSFK